MFITLRVDYPKPHRGGMSYRRDVAPLKLIPILLENEALSVILSEAKNLGIEIFRFAQDDMELIIHCYREMV